MSNINKVFLSGNLTREVELKTTPGGMVIAQIGLAVNGRRKDASGQWVDVPNYVDLVMFGNRAEGVSRIIGKGTKVAIEGQLRWRQWQDGNGNNRSKVEVLVDEIEVMARPQNSAPANSDYDLPF